jgi:hypothetical protein
MKKSSIKKSDLRTFSVIWSGLFAILSFYPYFFGSGFNLYFFSIALIFISISQIKPELLKGFYKLWVKFGNFMGNIISKVIMIVLFFLLFTPVSFVLKILRKDLLKKKMDKHLDTYWIERKIQPTSMKKQF